MLRCHAADLWSGVEGHDRCGLARGWALCGRGLAATGTRGEAGWVKRVVFRSCATTIGGVAGYASYMRMDPANGAIEVGNICWHRSLQRTTAATEAMYQMAKHVFEDLGYRRYEWKCNAKNEPSMRAALRLGFTYEGIFRQHMVVKGENRDTAWYSCSTAKTMPCRGSDLPQSVCCTKRCLRM